MEKASVLELRAVGLAVLGAWACGCGGNGVDAYSSTVEFTPASAVSPEDPFPDATRLQLGDGPTLQFSGELSTTQPLQVWDIGAVFAGTRLVVDVSGSGRNLSLGLFDEAQQVLIVNQDRYPRHDQDPYVVFDVREDSRALYLVVAADAQETDFGTYGARITQDGDRPVIEPRTQHVVLNFLGAKRIAVGGTSPMDVASFDAADLEPSWSGRTAEMIRIVLDSMERVYAGLDVRFHMADGAPGDVDLTWVHFGGSHPSNVGLAANVDYGNRKLQQSAIVYVQNFAKYIKYGYTHQEIAQGFANVAAHELGHLLGCNHSDDPADVMNVSPTVDALVAPQYFRPTAGLDAKVFPVGRQDGAAVILSAVGGDWGIVEAMRQHSRDSYAVAPPTRSSHDLGAAPAGLTQHSSAQLCGPECRR